MGYYTSKAQAEERTARVFSERAYGLLNTAAASGLLQQATACFDRTFHLCGDLISASKHGVSMRKTISIECRIDGTPEQYAAMIDFMRTHAQTILAGAQLIVGGVDKGLAVSFMTEDLYEGVTALPIDSGSDSDSGETNSIAP